MLVGALADAGADPDAIASAVDSLETGAVVSFEKVKRCGIARHQVSRIRRGAKRAPPSAAHRAR